MAKNNTKNDSYIAYLDFVGTKNSVSINEELYNISIKRILFELKKLSKKYTDVQSTMLSDSVFLSSHNQEIFSLLRELRVNLFTYSIYFTCAVQKGTLDLSSHADDGTTPTNLNYFTLGNPDTVKVFAKQSVLKGIGIDISPLAGSLPKKDYVTSYYFFNDNLVEFKDLSYTNPANASIDMILNNFRIHIDSIFRESNIQSMTNSNATKYYLTPFISLLTCALEGNHNITKDIFKITFELFDKPHFKENHYILCMYAYLINLRLKYNDDNELNNDFIKANKNNAFFKELIRNLNQIPYHLLSLQNKKTISEIIYSIS